MESAPFSDSRRHPPHRISDSLPNILYTGIVPPMHPWKKQEIRTPVSSVRERAFFRKFRTSHRHLSEADRYAEHPIMVHIVQCIPNYTKFRISTTQPGGGTFRRKHVENQTEMRKRPAYPKKRKAVQRRYVDNRGGSKGREREVLKRQKRGLMKFSKSAERRKRGKTHLCCGNPSVK